MTCIDNFKLIPSSLHQIDDNFRAKEKCLKGFKKKKKKKGKKKRKKKVIKN
jgi:hypothetical protein